MKKILFIAILFLIRAISFGQQTNIDKTPAVPDYLKKSQELKKAGFALLGAGGVLIITSALIPQGDLVKPGICVGIWCDSEYENDDIISAFFLVGTISVLSSIPVFIVSGTNKRKATSIGIKLEQTVKLSNKNLVYNSFPSITVKTNL